MPQVTSCPQCQHELLVPDGTSEDAWAKCPECRAVFQIDETAPRELPAVLVMDALQEADTMTAVSLSEVDGGADKTDKRTFDALETSVEPQAEAETLVAPDSSLADAAADRIEAWFRSAKTIDDSPRIVDDVPSSKSPWEDPQGMDRLLAEIEPPGADPADAVAERVSHANRETVETSTVALPNGAERPGFVPAIGGGRKRTRSPLRTAALVLAAGPVGLALGYYVLLWLRGENGDFLHVAKYLPSAILPAELRPPNPNVTPMPTPIAVEQTPGESDPPSAAAPESHIVQTTLTEPPSSNPAPLSQEPAPLDVPSSAAIVERGKMPEPIHIADAPTFADDDLAAALRAAKESQPLLVSGSLTDGKQVQQAKGRGYQALADLAQKLTFVNQSADIRSFESLRQQAEQLFRETLKDPAIRAEVARIAPIWIASSKRTHGGVFCAATLTRRGEYGQVAEFYADLGGGQSLTILTPAVLAERLSASNVQYGVVGWVVNSPTNQVPGYQGTAAQAIWAGQIIPLD